MAATIPKAKLRNRFLAWQCRIRQLAMRDSGGRPSPGMCPRVLARSGTVLAEALTVLLTPNEPAESTAYFRFQALRTPDPREAYERALAYLQSDFFQRPETFEDRLLAVLPQGSGLAAALRKANRVTLEFSEGRASYRLSCSTRELRAGTPWWEAAVWHNRLFNPALPDNFHVLAFLPDWSAAEEIAAGQDSHRS